MRTLTPLLIVALAATHAVADPPADDEEAPEVGRTIVIGLRLPRPMRDVPATVTVIDRVEIERSPKRSADDVVRTLPSAATFRRSSSLIADPTSQGVNLRGLGPSGVSRALVLRDGVPLNDPFGGWVYWRAISISAIDRIEVAPSGASALFGNFALGGVVQLFSRRITERRIEASASTGSFATRRASLRATERRGAVSVAIDADVLDSAGYTPIAEEDRGAVDGPAASRHGNLGARVEVLLGPSKLDVRGQLFDEELDAGTLHTTAAVRTATVGAGWLWVARAGTLELDVFGGAQRMEQQRARVDEARDTAEPSAIQDVPSNSQGASATWTTSPIGEHVLLVGLDTLRVEGTSHETLLPAMPMPSSVVGRASGGEQRFAGVFVQDLVRLPGDVDLAAALRLDGWENVDGARTTVRDDGETTRDGFEDRRHLELSPRVGVLKRFDVLALRATAYRAFRAPTLNELYRPFQVGTVLTDANPELRAEHVWGAETGAEVVLQAFVGRMTGFWNLLEDPINNVTLAEPSPTGATRQRQNLGRARIRGIELEASWRVTPAWIATAGYTFVDAVVTAAPGHDDLVDKRLVQDPRHRATATVTFDRAAIATVSVQGRLIGAQFEDDRNTLPMGSVFLLDASVARRIHGGLSIVASVENLFDREYVVGRAGVDTVGQPRSFHVGLTFDSVPR